MARAYSNGTDQPGQMEWLQFSVEIIGVGSGNSIMDNSNRDKIHEVKMTKIHIWKSETLL